MKKRSRVLSARPGRHERCPRRSVAGRWGAAGRDGRRGRAGRGAVGGAGAVAQAAGGARPGQGRRSIWRSRWRWAGTAWPTSRCCGPSRACSAGWPRTRRCPARSTRSPRTRPRRWRRSTPPGPRPGPGCGRWPVSTPPTTASTPTAPLVIDIDATLVTAHSEKEHAAPTFKRGFGFHPLWAFVDHGADGTGEPLAVLLRPGQRRLQHRRRPHRRRPRRRWRSCPVTGPGAGPAGKVLIRTDGAGATHEFLDWLHRRRLSYSVGFTLPDNTAELLTTIPAAGVDAGLRRRRRRSATAPGSPSSPACSTCPAGRPGCG